MILTSGARSLQLCKNLVNVLFSGKSTKTSGTTLYPQIVSRVQCKVTVNEFILFFKLCICIISKFILKIQKNIIIMILVIKTLFKDVKHSYLQETNLPEVSRMHNTDIYI